MTEQIHESLVAANGLRLTPLKPGEKPVTLEKVHMALELYAKNIPMTYIATITDLTIYSVKKILTIEGVYVKKEKSSSASDASDGTGEQQEPTADVDE